MTTNVINADEDLQNAHIAKIFDKALSSENDDALSQRLVLRAAPRLEQAVYSPFGQLLDITQIGEMFLGVTGSGRLLGWGLDGNLVGYCDLEECGFLCIAKFSPPLCLAKGRDVEGDSAEGSLGVSLRHWVARGVVCVLSCVSEDGHAFLIGVRVQLMKSKSEKKREKKPAIVTAAPSSDQAVAAGSKPSIAAVITHVCLVTEPNLFAAQNQEGAGTGIYTFEHLPSKVVFYRTPLAEEPWLIFAVGSELLVYTLQYSFVLNSNLSSHGKHLKPAKRNNKTRRRVGESPLPSSRGMKDTLRSPMRNETSRLQSPLASPIMSADSGQNSVAAGRFHDITSFHGVQRWSGLVCTTRSGMVVWVGFAKSKYGRIHCKSQLMYTCTPVRLVPHPDPLQGVQQMSRGDVMALLSVKDRPKDFDVEAQLGAQRSKISTPDALAPLITPSPRFKGGRKLRGRKGSVMGSPRPMKPGRGPGFESGSVEAKVVYPIETAHKAGMGAVFRKENMRELLLRAVAFQGQGSDLPNEAYISAEDIIKKILEQLDSGDGVDVPDSVIPNRSLSPVKKSRRKAGTSVDETSTGPSQDKPDDEGSDSGAENRKHSERDVALMTFHDQGEMSSPSSNVDRSVSTEKKEDSPVKSSGSRKPSSVSLSDSKDEHLFSNLMHAYGVFEWRRVFNPFSMDKNVQGARSVWNLPSLIGDNFPLLQRNGWMEVVPALARRSAPGTSLSSKEAYAATATGSDVLRNVTLSADDADMLGSRGMSLSRTNPLTGTVRSSPLGRKRSRLGRSRFGQSSFDEGAGEETKSDAFFRDSLMQAFLNLTDANDLPVQRRVHAISELYELSGLYEMLLHKEVERVRTLSGISAADSPKPKASKKKKSKDKKKKKDKAARKLEVAEEPTVEEKVVMKWLRGRHLFDIYSGMGISVRGCTTPGVGGGPYIAHLTPEAAISNGVSVDDVSLINKELHMHVRHVNEAKKGAHGPSPSLFDFRQQLGKLQGKSVNADPNDPASQLEKMDGIHQRGHGVISLDPRVSFALNMSVYDPLCPAYSALSSRDLVGKFRVFTGLAEATPAKAPAKESEGKTAEKEGDSSTELSQGALPPSARSPPPQHNPVPRSKTQRERARYARKLGREAVNVASVPVFGAPHCFFDAGVTTVTCVFSFTVPPLFSGDQGESLNVCLGCADGSARILRRYRGDDRVVSQTLCLDPEPWGHEFRMSPVVGITSVLWNRTAPLDGQTAGPVGQAGGTGSSGPTDVFGLDPSIRHLLICTLDSRGVVRVWDPVAPKLISKAIFASLASSDERAKSMWDHSAEHDITPPLSAGVSVPFALLRSVCNEQSQVEDGCMHFDPFADVLEVGESDAQPVMAATSASTSPAAAQSPEKPDGDSNAVEATLSEQDDSGESTRGAGGASPPPASQSPDRTSPQHPPATPTTPHPGTHSTSSALGPSVPQKTVPWLGMESLAAIMPFNLVSRQSMFVLGDASWSWLRSMPKDLSSVHAHVGEWILDLQKQAMEEITGATSGNATGGESVSTGNGATAGGSPGKSGSS